MSAEDLYTRHGERAVELRLHVQPGSGRSAVVGRHGDALKVRVAAPPLGGRANAACLDLLADTFGVGPEQVELTSGETSRIKRFRLSDLDVDDFERRLERFVGPSGRPRPPADTGPPGL